MSLNETECLCENCALERKMDKLINDLHEVVKKAVFTISI